MNHTKLWLLFSIAAGRSGCESVKVLVGCWSLTKKRNYFTQQTSVLIAGLSSAKKEGDFGIFTACTIKDNLRFSHLIKHWHKNTIYVIVFVLDGFANVLKDERRATMALASFIQTQ